MTQKNCSKQSILAREDALESMSALQQKAMSGDLQWVLSPATVGRAATGAAWQRTVDIALKTGDGQVHTWFNGTLKGILSVSDTSTAGTASISSIDLTLVNGQASVVVSGDARTWAAAETDTLRVGEAAILGYPVAPQISVQTFV